MSLIGKTIDYKKGEIVASGEVLDKVITTSANYTKQPILNNSSMEIFIVQRKDNLKIDFVDPLTITSVY